MVPPTIRPRTQPGEVKVFEALRDHPSTDGWLVWHGLPLRHHETQVEGEADFVIMVPGEGMLVVEVKSHDRLEVDDRGWSLGRGEPTARSPYDQVWDNSRSIRTWIERRAYVPGYPIWQAAWFPNVGGELTKRLEQRIDVPADATLTRAELDPSVIFTRRRHCVTAMKTNTMSVRRPVDLMMKSYARARRHAVYERRDQAAGGGCEHCRDGHAALRELRALRALRALRHDRRGAVVLPQVEVRTEIVATGQSRARKAGLRPADIRAPSSRCGKAQA